MTETNRLKGLFFAYFAYVGILSPYLSLYFSVQGFSVAQIGILMTVPNLLRIVAPAVLGVAGRQNRTRRSTAPDQYAADAGLRAVVTGRQ